MLPDTRVTGTFWDGPHQGEVREHWATLLEVAVRVQPRETVFHEGGDTRVLLDGAASYRIETYQLLRDARGGGWWVRQPGAA